jgi:hypothetical protein
MQVPEINKKSIKLPKIPARTPPTPTPSIPISMTKLIRIIRFRDSSWRRQRWELFSSSLTPEQNKLEYSSNIATIS